MVSRWTGVPITSIKEEETQKLLRVEEELHKRVISQDKAISALARAIRRSRAGLKNPARPIGSFLFLGPTGVGKTEMARTLAQFLFGSEKSLIRFDMSEFMEKHSVTKLIGSPPGYVGYEEGGQLTERVKRSPYSVVLLDEIEKAHPDVFNLLLQVFEDGQLTDGLGNTVDFKNTIVVMTSNIGAKHLQKREGLGFQSSNENMVLDKMEELVKGEVKRTFNPEFLNRLDEVIIFTSLTNTDLMQIMELLVQQMNANLVHKAITLCVTDDAKQWIWRRPPPSGPTARVLCGEHCSASSKTRSPRRSSPAASCSAPPSSRSTWRTTSSSTAPSPPTAPTTARKNPPASPSPQPEVRS